MTFNHGENMLSILKNTATELRQLADKIDAADADFEIPPQGISLREFQKIARSLGEYRPELTIELSFPRGEIPRMRCKLWTGKKFTDSFDTLNELAESIVEAEKPAPEPIDPIPALDAEISPLMAELDTIMGTTK